MPLQTIIISIAEEPNPETSYGFYIETQGNPVASNEEQWVRNLADHIAANPPASLGWMGPGVVHGIEVIDTAREVTPNA